MNNKRERMKQKIITILYVATAAALSLYAMHLFLTELTS